MGEEDLGCNHAKAGKGLGVKAHEVALPHGRAGLAQAQRARPLPEAEQAHAHADSAA